MPPGPMIEVNRPARTEARVPVDGVVASVSATIDESAVTGEPIPAELAEVFAIQSGGCGPERVRCDPRS